MPAYTWQGPGEAYIPLVGKLVHPGDTVDLPDDPCNKNFVPAGATLTPAPPADAAPAAETPDPAPQPQEG